VAAAPMARVLVCLLHAARAVLVLLAHCTLCPLLPARRQPAPTTYHLRLSFPRLASSVSNVFVVARGRPCTPVRAVVAVT
jgi:hypothetical protein